MDGGYNLRQVSPHEGLAARDLNRSHFFEDVIVRLEEGMILLECEFLSLRLFGLPDV